MQRALFGGAGPIYRLPRRIGMLKAKELMLTGKLLTGAEAKGWGLVNDSVPADQLGERVESFVADLADKSPFQMAITKMALNRGVDGDTETLMLVERLAAGVTLNSNDGRRLRGVPRETRPRVDGDLAGSCGLSGHEPSWVSG